MTMKVWMAQTVGGAWLCSGNSPNNYPLTLHLGMPVEAESLAHETFIFRQTRREVEVLCAEWHEQLRRKYGKAKRGSRVHPVKTLVRWEPILDDGGAKTLFSELGASVAPWKREGTTIDDAKGEPIAYCCTWNARALKDAKVIEATPRLYEATRKLVEAVRPFRQWWRNDEVLLEAEEAIAMAEGRK